MKRKLKQVTKVVTELTDPKPEFVSLVDHGANQTPFRSVKRSASTILDNRENHTEDTDMTTKKDNKGVPATAEIQKMVFTGEFFTDTVKVEDYLEAKGYTDCVITSKGDTFEVVAKDFGSFEGDTKEISLEGGVTYHVGVLKEGEEKLEEVTDTKKREESVKKYDTYFAQYSNGVTIEEVMKDGADGLPPGIYEINDAFYTALRNIVTKGDLEEIEVLTAEFGSVISKLVKTLRSATVPSEKVEKVLDKMFGKVLEEATTKVDTEEPAVEAVETDTEVKEEDTATPVVEEPKTEVEATEGVSSKETIAEEVAKAVSAALSPLSAVLEALATTVKTSTEDSKKSLADLGEKVSKTGERVEALEAVRQTRKSADSDVNEASTKEELAKKKEDHSFLRDTLGFL